MLKVFYKLIKFMVFSVAVIWLSHTFTIGRRTIAQHVLSQLDALSHFSLVTAIPDNLPSRVTNRLKSFWNLKGELPPTSQQKPRSTTPLKQIFIEQIFAADREQLQAIMSREPNASMGP